MTKKQWEVFAFFLVLALCIALILCGCQSYKKVEYYENGQIKMQEERSGIPDWSDNKQFNINASKL